MNNKSYSIDIILPNFNKSEYLKEAIESVLNQTFQNWKLYIIDDCSTDYSILNILKEKKNQKIKIINLKKNGGPGRARNIGIKKSRGKYIVKIILDISKSGKSIKIDHPDLQNSLQIVSREVYVILDSDKYD